MFVIHKLLLLLLDYCCYCLFNYYWPWENCTPSARLSICAPFWYRRKQNGHCLWEHSWYLAPTEAVSGAFPNVWKSCTLPPVLSWAGWWKLKGQIILIGHTGPGQQCSCAAVRGRQAASGGWIVNLKAPLLSSLAFPQWLFAAEWKWDCVLWIPSASLMCFICCSFSPSGYIWRAPYIHGLLQMSLHESCLCGLC